MKRKTFEETALPHGLAREAVSHPAFSRNQIARSLSRMMFFNMLQGIGTWRWLLVPLLFGVATLLYENNLTFDAIQQTPRPVNIWDFMPAMLININYILWVFVLGFIVLVGDNYLYERQQGTIALTLVRMPSRTAWWIAKVGSIGLMALCYVGIGLVVIILVSAFKVPIELVASEAIMLPQSATDLYPRWNTIPIPIFVLLVGLYTAFALWIIVSVIVTTSLLVQRTFIPIGIGILWVILSSMWISSGSNGYSRLLNLSYFLSYAKHLSGPGSMSLTGFFCSSIAVLALVLVLGAWRLRQVDL